MSALPKEKLLAPPGGAMTCEEDLSVMKLPTCGTQGLGIVQSEARSSFGGTKWIYACSLLETAGLELPVRCFVRLDCSHQRMTHSAPTR